MKKSCEGRLTRAVCSRATLRVSQAALLAVLLSFITTTVCGATILRAKHVDKSRETFGRLYVAGGIFSRSGIVAFPLNARGLPYTTPDFQLVGGLKSPSSLAFDGQGYMYVSDDAYVKVYAPGARGQDQPVRAINVNGPQWVAVDNAGYVYVVSGFTTIDVFAPGAGPSSQPINTITVGGNNFVFGLAASPGGTVYAAGFPYPIIYEYNDPVHEQTPDRTFTRPVPDFSWPIGFDATQNRLYFREGVYFYDPWYEGEYGATNPDFSPISPSERAAPFIFQSNDCVDQGSSGTVESGVAANANYLMYSCDAGAGGVLVYKNAPGRHKLIERLNGYANGIVIGP